MLTTAGKERRGHFKCFLSTFSPLLCDPRHSVHTQCPVFCATQREIHTHAGRKRGFCDVDAKELIRRRKENRGLEWSRFSSCQFFSHVVGATHMLFWLLVLHQQQQLQQFSSILFSLRMDRMRWRGERERGERTVVICLQLLLSGSQFSFFLSLLFHPSDLFLFHLLFILLAVTVCLNVCVKWAGMFHVTVFRVTERTVLYSSSSSSSYRVNEGIKKKREWKPCREKTKERRLQRQTC